MARPGRMAVWTVAGVAVLVGLMLSALPAQPAAPPSETASPPAAGPGAAAFGVDMATPQHPGGSAAHPSTVALLGAGWVRIIADW